MSGKELVADGMIHVKDFKGANNKFLILIKTPQEGKFTVEINKHDLDCAVHTVHVDDFVINCGVTIHACRVTSGSHQQSPIS